MKVCTIIGARPQFIKASVVSAAIANSASLSEVVIHTGQHFDKNMSDIFFSEMGMEQPAYHLNVNGGGHGEMTGRMLIEIEKVFLAEKPDAVLVYGDTNSTLAGALVAVKLHIPIAHVEAGLRSHNMTMPEEINRILTDRVSSILFCPTESAIKNLADEGFTNRGPRIRNVGDVMYDVALHYGSHVAEDGGMLGKVAATHGIAPGKYCLATIHRAENTDDPQRLKDIFTALSTFSNEIPVILPLHPRTRKIIETTDGFSLPAHGGLVFIDPVGYLDMVQLEKHAALIATDSGGVQKEAFFYKVPCVTLRDETEWVELVSSGWNRLVPPTDVAAVLSGLRAGLGSQGEDVQPYGHGNASSLIVESLLKDLK